MKFTYEQKQIIEFINRKKLFCPPCMHHAIEIFYLRTGSLTVNIDDVEYDMQAGDIISIFPDIIHSYYNCTEESGSLLIVPVDLLDPFYSIISKKRPKNPLIKSDDLEKTNIPEIIELFKNDEKENEKNINIRTAYSHLIIGKILEIYDYENAFLRYDSHIQEVLTFIHENYAKNPTRKQIARATGLNENYVSRLFSERLHCSMLQYLRTIQLQHAANYLRNSNSSIGEISEKTGFNSIRSFNRNFQIKYGISPREYRKSIKG